MLVDVIIQIINSAITTILADPSITMGSTFAKLAWDSIMVSRMSKLAFSMGLFKETASGLEKESSSQFADSQWSFGAEGRYRTTGWRCNRL